MTQFPTIKARFDAALTIIEGAPTVGHNLEETKKLSADLDKAYEDAATAEAKLKTAQADIEEAKTDVEKMRAALKKEQDLVKILEKDLAEKDGKVEAQRTAMIKQIDALDKARADSQEDLETALQYSKRLENLNESLRKSNEQNVANPELINKSLETELAEIKARRSSDLETVNSILARLTPLVEGAQDG